MVSRVELVTYCNDVLDADRFDDYCPNGLQVQGNDQIKTLVSGVTASQALIEAAIEANADALLVHHGWFWRGEPMVVVGAKYRRIKALMEHGINLLAYHLPLDAHIEHGNNAALARILGLQHEGIVDKGPGKGILFYGRLPQAMSAAALSEHIGKALQREPLTISASDKPISSVAWCTGAAQSLIEQAVMLGVDAFISGEISEQTTHIARESGIHYFAAGHHATERYGVQALAEHLAKHFALQHHFIDIDNPV